MTEEEKTLKTIFMYLAAPVLSAAMHNKLTENVNGAVPSIPTATLNGMAITAADNLYAQLNERGYSINDIAP